MRLVKIMERGGEDYHEYKKALKKLKESVDIICELSDDMEEQYSSRGGSMRRSRKYRKSVEDDDMDYD